MHCPACGYSEPGQAAGCPSCGRVFASASATSAPPQPVGPDLVRPVVYVLLAFAVSRGFGKLYDAYLKSEADRVESVLLSQNMERRKRLMDPEDLPPAPQPAPADVASDPAPGN